MRWQAITRRKVVVQAQERVCGAKQYHATQLPFWEYLSDQDVKSRIRLPSRFARDSTEDSDCAQFTHNLFDTLEVVDGHCH